MADVSVTTMARRTVRALRRVRRRARKRLVLMQQSGAGFWTAMFRPLRSDDLHRVHWHTRRLHAGWVTVSLTALHAIADDPTEARFVREAASQSIRDYEHRPPPAGATAHYDVVILSHFGLPGGTSSSNAEEIIAQHAAGLTTGLVHQPHYEWNVAAPFNPRISALVDMGFADVIEDSTDVTCTTLIIRGPQTGGNLRDTLPSITAKRTVVVVNQTPARHYTDAGARDTIYRVAEADARYATRFGPVTWYAISPRVRDVLVTHHSDDLGGVNLSEDTWHNIIDTARWRTTARDHHVPSSPLRIGRHSRDSLDKWPETRELIHQAYPERADIEVKVLGGADSLIEHYGSLPHNWTVYQFNSVPVPRFLATLDVYVYFPASHLAEAFGRAPLEAMAAGIPTILPTSFEALFEDGAQYCAPHEVQGLLEALREPDTYRHWSQKAHALVARRFSHRSHTQRLAQPR